MDIIKAKNMNLWYGNFHALKNVNLSLPEKQITAMIGPSGCGKSTFLRLFNRMNDMIDGTKLQGQCLIDGKDIKQRSLKWLHSNIGYVLQNPYLFSGTIRDNLKYGKEDATDDEILAAIKQVGAERILKKLKDGLDTELGEGGDYLSTGEKQIVFRGVLNNSLSSLDHSVGVVKT